MMALSVGSIPAVGSTPHVLQFNYDEDDVETLDPFLATAAPNAPFVSSRQATLLGKRCWINGTASRTIIAKAALRRNQYF